MQTAIDDLHVQLASKGEECEGVRLQLAAAQAKLDNSSSAGLLNLVETLQSDGSELSSRLLSTQTLVSQGNELLREANVGKEQLVAQLEALQQEKEKQGHDQARALVEQASSLAAQKTEAASMAAAAAAASSSCKSADLKALLQAVHNMHAGVRVMRTEVANELQVGYSPPMGGHSTCPAYLYL